MEQTKRLEYVDVVAGIMIIWMILGHCNYFSSFQQLPYRKFLSFYMPWFFYKSGMLFSTKGYVELLKKDAIKYLRVFVVYSFIGWFVWSICGLIGNTLSLKECISSPIHSFIKSGCISKGNGALWFLLSMFFVRQIGNFVLKIKLHPLIASLICFSIAFLLYYLKWYNHSWWFGNVFAGLCFFFLGYWLKETEQKRWVFIVSILVFGLVLCAYLFGLTDDFPYLYMHANKMYRGNYLLFFPMAVAGIIITNNIFRILCKHIRFRILGYVGFNSMNFYVTHWILFTIVVFVSKTVFRIEEPLYLFWILVGSSIIFLPLINKAIKSLKAKKTVLSKIL